MASGNFCSLFFLLIQVACLLVPLLWLAYLSNSSRMPEKKRDHIEVNHHQ